MRKQSENETLTCLLGKTGNTLKFPQTQIPNTTRIESEGQSTAIDSRFYYDKWRIRVPRKLSSYLDLPGIKLLIRQKYARNNPEAIDKSNLWIEKCQKIMVIGYLH